MEQKGSKSSEVQYAVAKYCDRCARRVAALVFDDLSLQRLCQDCSDRLLRLRGTRPQLY